MMNKTFKFFFCLIVVCAALLVARSANASIVIGNAVNGANNGQTLTNGTPICASTTVAFPGTIDSISVLASSTPQVDMGVGIYSNNGGTGRPNAPLVTDMTGTTPASKDWATTTISLSVTPGTTYWLCVWMNRAAANFYYNNTSAGYQVGYALSNVLTWPTWPNPFNTNTFNTTRRVAIYANYTPSSLNSHLGVIGAMTVKGNLTVK